MHDATAYASAMPHERTHVPTDLRTLHLSTYEIRKLERDARVRAQAIPHHVYLFYWPGPNAVKVGCSKERRWRSFLDGDLVASLLFEGGSEAYDFEESIHQEVWTWPGTRRAFTSMGEAEPYLRSGGGGYMECYAALPETFERLLRKFVPAEVPA